MHLRFATLPLLVAALAAGQAPADPPTLDALLDQIAAHAASYRATLPSLSAQESITSQTSGLFKQRAEAQATFRVTRQESDARFHESRQITELNGKPVAAGKQVHLPVTFHGAFGDALEIFFAPALRPCYDFTLTPRIAPDGSQRSDFSGRPGSEANPACAHTPARVTGFVLIDPATKQIRHLERTVPEDVAKAHHLASFASVDYATAKIGEQSFWLPAVIVARLNGGKAEFVARYSGYQRFTGTVTLMPNVTSVDTPPR